MTSVGNEPEVPDGGSLRGDPPSGTPLGARPADAVRGAAATTIVAAAPSAVLTGFHTRAHHPRPARGPEEIVFRRTPTRTPATAPH
ncbi:hypothetical protein [Microtetraspora malaysiensis]|uniref:hypothetical protein n=1 Tax=Microtetraspora malaysiensis TaxID=161358 RepID=UPI003D8E5FF1